MQSIKLRNMETEESVWLNLPSSYQTIREVFAGLGEPEMVQIVGAEVREPILEKHLKGKMLILGNGVNELEFLDLRLEGLTAQEKEIFLAALEIEKPHSVMEIVNLSCNLDKFAVYPGAVDEEALGNYILEHRKDVQAEYTAVQAEEIGRHYAGEHSGYFSESGYIFRTGKALQAVYDGKHCPYPAYDSEAVFMVTLPRERGKGRRGMLSLALPASEEKLEAAAGNLGIADVGKCVPSSLQASDWSLTSHLPMSYDIRGLNGYARCLKDTGILESEEKQALLFAALEAELPEDMDGAAEIAKNLGRYRLLPKEVSEPAVYARYVLKDWMPQVDERLDDFIDFEGYGKYRMREDGVVQTEYGMIERMDCPLSQLPEELSGFKLFSPLKAELYPFDGWGGTSDHATELYSCDLGMYEDAIRKMAKKECRDLKEDCGLAEYLRNSLLKRKVASMMPTVESWKDELWGVLEVKVHGELTDGELKKLAEEWSGQASDGWGEGFEQRPIRTEDGEMYVSCKFSCRMQSRPTSTPYRPLKLLTWSESS